MTVAFAWLNPDSDGTWSDGPQFAAESLRSVLAEHTGAVLVGTHEDRRRVIQTALEHLSPDRPVYHLHGSTFASEISYGSLSILLARLEISPGASWHHTTKALGEFLSPEGSEPAVVIVSQSQLMDRDSVTVLAQLAQQRRVTLVVQCDRHLDLPPDFAALARAGSLKHVAVRPLTPAAVREVLSDELGGPVSRVAATVLWRYSGGHAGQLRHVAQDCVASGKLRQVDGHWVLRSGPMPSSERTAGQDVVLRRMPARHRALLERLASRGPVQVGELVHAGHGTELDTLQGQGIVQIRSTPDGRVVVVQPIWRDRILAALEPERRNELDRAVDEQDADLRQLLRRAEDHLVTADVAGALALLDPIGRAEDHAAEDQERPTGGFAPSTVRSHLVWARARALAACGDLTDALRVVEGSAEAQDPCLTVLVATVAAARGDLPGARHWLELTSALHRTDLFDSQSPGRNEETVRLRAEATRAEVLAFSDDQEGARRATAWVDAQLATFHQRGVLDDIMSTYDRAALAVSLLDVRLRCGDLEACRELSEAILTARHGNPQAILYAELADAAVDLLSGRLDLAEETATQLGLQCEASGDRHAMAVAQALAAFCRSARGREHLPSRPEDEGVDAETGAVPLRMWGRLGWFGEVIRSLTVDSHQPGDVAEARLATLAERARVDGLVVVELHALLGAALLGSSGLATQLQRSADSTQSAVSGPSAELGAAILADDPAAFCNALTGLAAAGYTGWCHGGITPAVATLSPAHARRLAEAVAVQRRSAPEPAREAIPSWMEALTPRERDIAQQVVDGLSNAMVARRNGISVRTVEGHLYQIYAKLQVHGRLGLTRLAARSAHLHAVE